MLFKKNKADVEPSLDDAFRDVLDDFIIRFIGILMDKTDVLEKKIDLLIDHLGVEIVEEQAKTVIKKKKGSK